MPNLKKKLNFLISCHLLVPITYVQIMQMQNPSTKKLITKNTSDPEKISFIK